MKLPHQVFTICELLRANAKIKHNGGPTCKINGKTFQMLHVKMAKQVMFIARAERRKLLTAVDELVTPQEEKS